MFSILYMWLYKTLFYIIDNTIYRVKFEIKSVIENVI